MQASPGYRYAGTKDVHYLGSKSDLVSIIFFGKSWQNVVRICNLCS